MIKKLLDRTTPRQRVIVAEIIFWLSLAGFPLTWLTVAKEEPPVVLGLSWLAVTITCLDVIMTADVKRDDDDE